MKGLAKGARGSTLMETIVATAILGLFGILMAGALGTNVEMKAEITRKQQFLEGEAAIRGALFQAYSTYAESKPDCKKPGTKLNNIWSKATPEGLKLTLLNRSALPHAPGSMQTACTVQSGSKALSRSIFQCFKVADAGGGKIAAFFDRYDVYVMASFLYWNTAEDTASDCQTFKDGSVRLRGGKLHYVVQWREKDPKKRKDERFQKQPGYMYGQTRALP